MSNDEKLIELVHGYPVLYDLCNPKYMDSDFKNAIWAEIGAEMETNASLCKSRWANIRDNFRKSLNKQKTKSGQKATKVKPYKYSEQLNFLRKFFAERETMTNIEAEDTSVDFASDKETEEISPENKENTQGYTKNVNDPVIQSESEIPSKSKSTGTIPRKTRKLPNNTPPKTAAATVMEYIVERNKNMNCPPPPQHPVDAFLAGIAPALKTLSSRDWHYAKGEIFATVQKYEYNMLNQQFADPPASMRSDITCLNGQPSPAESYVFASSTSDGQQSNSGRAYTGQNKEKQVPDLTLREYLQMIPE